MNTTPNSPVLQPLLFSKKDLGNCFLRPLSEREVEFHNMYYCVLELLSTEEKIALDTKSVRGRKGFDLSSMFGIMLLKLHYRICTIKETLLTLEENGNLRYILGLDKVPAESTVSSALKRVETIIDIQNMHGVLIEAYRVVAGQSIVEHLSIDSTVIEVREKPVTPVRKKKNEPQKRGRKKKGSKEQEEYLKQKAEEEALKQQYYLEEPKISFGNLENRCSLTAKKNSKGKAQWYTGYKAHFATDDHGVPLSYAITGASVHDSQCAIPLAKMVKQRLFFILYVLGDKAYNSVDINHFFETFTQAKFIADVKSNSKYELTPNEVERYKNRTTVERTNAELKESFLPPVIYRRSSQARFEISLAVLLTTVKMVERVIKAKGATKNAA